MVALLCKDSLHYGRADADCAADLENAHAFGLQLANSRFYRRLHRPQAQLGALRLRFGETAVYPLPDDVAYVGPFPTLS
jgi:hypothetical protein